MSETNDAHDRSEMPLPMILAKDILDLCRSSGATVKEQLLALTVARDFAQEDLYSEQSTRPA